MLTHLHLENIAIIPSLEVQFEAGLIALTGETGSGKSLLLDALQLVFSKKFSAKDYLRQGSARGRVELSFDLHTHPQRDSLAAKLTELGIEIDLSDEPLILSRDLTPQSSRSRIQGTLVPMETLEGLSADFLEMHGQHDLHHLFHPSAHREIVDRLGGAPLLSIKKSLKDTYRAWQQALSAKQQWEQKQADQARQLDFLRFQLTELDEAHLTHPEEDTEIETQRKRLASASELSHALEKALSALQGDNSEARSTNTSPSLTLQQAIKTLSNWTPILPELTPVLQHLECAQASLEEATSGLHQAQDSVELNPEQLDMLIERQDQLSRLKRKYGPTLADVMAQHHQIQREYDALSNAEEEAEHLAQTCLHLESQVQELSLALRDLRQAVIPSFENAVRGHLSDLMLDKARFDVAISALEVPNESGLDSIEFRFSANPGEPLKSLGQVASGGELARVMLAIRLQTMADAGPFLVLDEIDAGLSGQALRSLADKLALLSQHHQILVVTHHPLLAAKATQHWHLEKQHDTSNDETTVQARLLTDSPEREHILGQMASGETQQDDVTRQFIQTLLKTG